MSININRFFKLGIRNKLMIAFMGLSSVPLLLSGLYAVRVHTEALQKSEVGYLEHDVLAARERTGTFLNGVESDIRFLGGSYLFRRFLQHPHNREIADAFVQQILDFVRNKSIFYQIRYLDGEGQEAVKVRADAGGYIALPGDESVGGRYYLNMVEGLHQGDLASSPVELKDDRGGIVAAISYVLPVFESDLRPAGMIVVDVFAEELFRIVEEAHNEPNERVVLVSGEGYYLYHSEKKRRWGQLLASRDEHNIYRDYPPGVARQIMSGEPGMLISNGEVIASAPLLENAVRKPPVYTLFISAPRNKILASVIRFERVFYGLLGLAVVLSVGLAYLAAAQFTRPINALQAEAEVIAGGEFGHRLRVETYDEIQRLAETFDSMARAIQDREAQIRRHESELEETVAARTRELAEEKGKLQAILDSVPSAFVVLDRNLHILSASSAFERISGHAPATVIGQHYGRFFPDCSEGRGGCPAETALRMARIATDVQSLKIPGREKPRYIERIAIPVARNGATEQVIEVVTDVTERKEMESQLIHSEKLATTGEMAAIIAHEMRNSLTSVKMILQLELERENLPESDREALEVATNSVLRMEAVVTDLLKFARPSPPQFQPQSVNAILRESISLIQHQIRRKALVLTEGLSPDLPPVQGDADQLKEVFVNLLLNAAQATPDGGEISISSRLGAGGGRVEVRVEDTGPGIPEGYEERIFDPFFTTKTDGTGLGLSMTRRTVEAHGGSISATNGPDGGALFTVWLPASETEIPETKG